MNIVGIFHHIRHFFLLHRELQRDPRVSGIAKSLPWIALGYLVLPFDIIPDFLPLLGQLDDALIVPLLLYLALQFLSKNLRADLEGKIIDVPGSSRKSA